jgi:hypothetical protein
MVAEENILENNCADELFVRMFHKHPEKCETSSPITDESSKKSISNRARIADSETDFLDLYTIKEERGRTAAKTTVTQEANLLNITIILISNFFKSLKHLMELYFSMYRKKSPNLEKRVKF